LIHFYKSSQKAMLLGAGSPLLVLCPLIVMLVAPLATVAQNTEEDAKVFLGEYNLEYGRLLNLMTVAAWNYETNITDFNEQIQEEASLNLTLYSAEAFNRSSQFNTDGFSDDTKRQLSKVGSKSLSEDLTRELSQTIASMGKIYGSTKVCVGPNDTECFNLEPGLTDIMAEENMAEDYDIRLKVWQGWRDQVGQANKPLYERYVVLKNQLAVLNGHDDLGDDWRDKYETDTFGQDVQALYRDLEPLYVHLHAYIRRKLFDVYGEENVDLTGPLPAHLLGDMWGRFWNNLYPIAVPYPDKPPLVPTEAMVEQNYTALKMFQTGDNFYKGLGMMAVPETFWNLSMLEKPEDGREVICHATAWDFYDAKDFRIRMCTRANNFEDLQTIHHELGHIQYQQNYKHLPQVYRDGANDGFHEAIGELMSLVSSTPSYLSKLGLLDSDNQPDEQQDLNFLMSQALTTVSTLPFHLTYDLWRWNIFSGSVPVEEWNQEFWRLKKELVGVAPAVDRDDDRNLDGTALFHINQDYDMIRYFVRTILQFQFLESLCEESGHTGPLHRCDFSGSEAAGSKLADMLALGSSLPWPQALQKLTGTEKMSTQPILEFFKPLQAWLEAENARNGETIGWLKGKSHPKQLLYSVKINY